jgi:uncharacterized membrane protein YwzB
MMVIGRIALLAIVLLICVGIGYYTLKNIRLDWQSLQLIPRNPCQGIAAPSLLCKGGSS